MDQPLTEEGRLDENFFLYAVLSNAPRVSTSQHLAAQSLRGMKVFNFAGCAVVAHSATEVVLYQIDVWILEEHFSCIRSACQTHSHTVVRLMAIQR